VGNIFEPILYWRILLVGWGTVILTTILMAFALAGWHISLLTFFRIAFYGGILQCIGIGTAVSVLLLIPMLIIWMPIYSAVRQYVVSVRNASTLSAALTAAAGMILFGLIFGIRGGHVVSLTPVFLPWIPVTMGIAACLTWFAFRSEQFAGGK
jgi:hypothetical protein